MSSGWSELESARFNLDTYRFEADEVNESLLRAMAETNADLIILRIPASELKNVGRLRQLGAQPLLADTLVYYTYDCSLVPTTPASSPFFEIRAANAADQTRVESLCLEIFDDYENHYASNPLLGRDVVPAAYAEWATNYIGQDERAGRQCWVATAQERVVGLATTRLEGDTCEIVLNGVSRSQRGRGIYRALVAHVQAYARSHRCTEVFTSTQVGNLAPQGVWSRQGFFLRRAVNTIHLNLLMSTRYVIGQGTCELRPSGSRTQANELLYRTVFDTLTKDRFASDQATARHHEFFTFETAESGEKYSIRSLVHTVPARPEHQVLTVDVRSSQGALIACGRSFPADLCL